MVYHSNLCLQAQFLTPTAGSADIGNFIIDLSNLTSNWMDGNVSPIPPNELELMAQYYHDAQFAQMSANYRYSAIEWVNIAMSIVFDFSFANAAGVVPFDAWHNHYKIDICENFACENFLRTLQGTPPINNADAHQWKPWKPGKDGAFHFNIKWKNPLKSEDQWMDTARLSTSNAFPWSLSQFKVLVALFQGSTVTSSNVLRSLRVLNGFDHKHMLLWPAIRISYASPGTGATPLLSNAVINWDLDSKFKHYDYTA